MRKLNGSFTIEISLLMPFILGVIILIIYLSFYCYDYAYINQTAYMSALRGTFDKAASNDEAFKESKMQSGLLLNSRVLAKKSIDEQISVSFSKITVSYKLSMLVPIQGLLDFALPKNVWDMSTTRYVKRLRPAVFIRLCEKISGGMPPNTPGGDHEDE